MHSSLPTVNETFAELGLPMDGNGKPTKSKMEAMCCRLTLLLSPWRATGA